jgi:Kef-type K+ transport system membrane component KefB
MELIPAAGLNFPPMMRLASTAFLLLFVPLLMQRMRIPSCVGFILAGVVVGPHGLGIIPRHAEAATFLAELGKLLLMFFVGLEIDLAQFKASGRRSLVFGLATFALPMSAGMAVGFGFGYSTLSAVLVGSLLASHTLIAYPQVEAQGQTGRLAVTITVGATILTDILSLLILAICVTTHKTGFDPVGFVIQIGETVLFIAVVLVGLGLGGRRLFHWFQGSDDAAMALLLLIVAAASLLAEAIQLEGILGAFVAGLAVNSATRTSPAKAKLQVIGTSFFIPTFFLTTGFLIDLAGLGNRDEPGGLPVMPAENSAG